MPNHHITGLRVEIVKPGRIDGGEYHKPIWHLKWFHKDKARMRVIKCGGDSRPLGQDLENACKGLGLTTDEIYAIPIIDLP